MNRLDTPVPDTLRPNKLAEYRALAHAKTVPISTQKTTDQRKASGRYSLQNDDVPYAVHVTPTPPPPDSQDIDFGYGAAALMVIDDARTSSKARETARPMIEKHNISIMFQRLSPAIKDCIKWLIANQSTPEKFALFYKDILSRIPELKTHLFDDNVGIFKVGQYVGDLKIAAIDHSRDMPWITLTPPKDPRNETCMNLKDFLEFASLIIMV